MLKLMTRTGLVVALGVLVAVPAAGQRRNMRQAPGMRAAGVERILQMRERLELTDEQLDQLNTIRREALTRRQAHATELMQLRSDLAAGELTRAEVRDRMAARRQASEEVVTAERERVRAILTDEQRTRLGQAARRAMRGSRAGMRERGPAWGGRDRGWRDGPRQMRRPGGRWDGPRRRGDG